MMITTTMSMMNPVRLKLIICMLCLAMHLVCAQHQMMCIPRERQALLQFKAALVDPDGMLSSWSNSSDCCQWHGIRCSNLTAHVLMLDLYDDEFSVSGKIHKSLTELRQLKYLNLSWNSFEDRAIPEFLGSLTNLRYLDLSSCGFRGEIPTQFGSLSHLKYLNLAGNYYLEGVIPPQLGNLSNLQHLDLTHNSIEGKIPSQLGNLSNLQHLNLTHNSIEGKIPSQLGNLSNLQHLDLSYNSFEGNIPSQLGNLSRLQYLDLSYNSFEGNIPSQLGNLSNLQKLYLGGFSEAFKIDDGNQWLSNLISLTHLDLSSINLNSSHSWLQMILKLPKLRELSLVDCSLSDHFILSSRPYKFNSSTSLSILDLSENSFTSSMIFQWVSNITSNLVELDLSDNLLKGSTSNHVGVAMNSLEHLDLSFNGFKGEDLKSFMNICTLHSLYLNENNLTEDLPSIFHNLSSGCVSHSLQELDFSSNQITGSLPDLSVFSSLKSLHLDQNQLRGKIPEGIRLPSTLKSLSISSNSLEGGVPKSFGSACSLESLDLSYNKFSEELSVISLSACSRYLLRQLYVSGNKIPGILPDFSMFSKLEILYLSGNQLKEIGVPKSFQNASTLRSLDLSNNNLSGNLPMIIHHLSRYAGYSLQELDMSMNQISGTLPNLPSMFPSLRILRLYQNKLNGTISEDVRFPTEIEELDLSSNSLKGVITNFHFANMSKLKTLDLSGNSLTLAFTPNWVPSFQLDEIRLGYCKVGPTFPKWLQTQNAFSDLDISNAGISDTVPKWFWAKLALEERSGIDISRNNLQGVIPNFPLKNHGSSLNLGSNQFEGPIPPFLRGYMALDLSRNKFSEYVSFLCDDGAVETLDQLDLSNNQLSGQIPDCWGHFKSLSFLNLSHNKFSGKIPTSMGSIPELQVLLLRNSNLTDEVPSSLRNCTKLVMLDMAENRLSGPIPAWIGSELQELKILSLGGNHFYGSLPLQICYLKSIQLLDLSRNNLFGRIPKCIKNFASMTQKTFSRDYPPHSHYYYPVPADILFQNLKAVLMWKGLVQMFMNNELSLLKSIDLSSNHFSEEIPSEIEYLIDLVSLNLSGNNLTGKIPSNIGKLTSLEFLDLSRNQLVGSIPWSLTQIDRLTMLDVSHNHLSGMIPTGTQLQSFNASSYEYNLDLCGPPLEKLCTDGEPTQEPIVKLHEDDNLLFTREFYMSMAIGFVISFWGVFGSILIKRSWRHAYFKFVSNLADKTYVMAAVKVFKWWPRR